MAKTWCSRYITDEGADIYGHFKQTVKCLQATILRVHITFTPALIVQGEVTSPNLL